MFSLLKEFIVLFKILYSETKLKAQYCYLNKVVFESGIQMNGILNKSSQELQIFVI